MTRTTALAASAFGLGFSLLAGIAQAQTPTTRDLTPVQRPMAEVGAGKSTLKADVWVDRRDQTYQLGDSVGIRVRVNEDAYVSIVNVGSSGRAHVIFPNRFEKENRVRAGEVLELPRGKHYHFKATGQPGTDLIKVVATRKPHRITDDSRLAEAGDYRRYTGTPEALSRDLGVELKEKHEERNDAGAAVADVVIRILPDR
jgi:hypothetical protein